MIRIALVLATLLALYYAILWVRDLEPEVQKRLAKWTIGAGVVALLAVPLIRMGLHWYAAAGSTAFVVLRRAFPWALRGWPLARKIWQRRRDTRKDDEGGSGDSNSP